LKWDTDGKTHTSLFYRYNPQGAAWSAEFFSPADYTGYADMDRLALSALEPPNARYEGRYTDVDVDSLPMPRL
jgi:hypothetical protein